jgi:hypothetical protein
MPRAGHASTGCRPTPATRSAFAGVALGIARAALDDFIDLARNKVPRGQRSPLRDNAVVSRRWPAPGRVARRALLLHRWPRSGMTSASPAAG